MIVKNLSVNILVVKSATVGALLAVLIGVANLTACSNQKKVKNLRTAVESCRNDSKEIGKMLRKKNSICQKELKYCRKIRNKLLEKMEFYESKICD